MARAKTSNKAEKSPVNNKVSFNLIFMSGSVFKGKSDSRPGVDQLDQPVLVYLFPKVVDIDVDEIGARIESSLPNLFSNLSPGKHPPAVLHHVVQQFKFLWAQVDLDATPRDHKGCGVQLQISDLQNGRSLSLLLTLAFSK